MKKLFYLFFAFVVVALLSSCEKDPVAPPDPDPDPHVNPTIEIQIEFQKSDNNLLLGCNQLLVVNADRTEGIQAIPFNEPISTVRITGDKALELIGHKVYIYMDISRIYPPNGGLLIMQKAIDSLVALPGINKLVVVVSTDISVIQKEIDP